MLYPEKVKILAKKNQPKPEEARYWIDLTADPYGGIWKVWNGLTWIRVFAGSGSGGGIEEAPSDGNLYGRKNQVWQEIDIPDVSIYATKTELEQKADKDSVPDLSDYLTASDIARYYQPKGEYLTEIPEGYLTITEADGRYALKGESGEDIDLSDYLTIAVAAATYATKSEVQIVREYAQTIELNKQDTLQNGVNIKSIDGQSIVGSGAIKVWKEAPTDSKLYGRQSAQWVEIQLPTDYVTEDDLTDYMQKGDLGTDTVIVTMQNMIDTNQSRIETAEDRIDDLGTEVDSKQDTLVSGTNIKTINGTSLLGSGNITLETPEGGLSDAASDGKLYGRKDGTWSEIVIPDTSGLATKTELSNKLDTETYNADKATFALKTEIPDTSTFITTETADGKYQPKGTYLTEVPDEYVTDAELTEQLALKANANELSNYLTIASATSTYATKTDLDSKLDTSTYTSDKSTFATTTQLASKQDTLVSGTNIKTVNGQTILGEGNIQIETPEGGIADAPSDNNTYARKNGAWAAITIPDTSNLATKAELSSYATLGGAQFTGTIGAPMIAVVDNSDGMRAAIQSSNNDILFRTYNAGIDSMTFQVQNSTPLKITEAGIWENNILLQNKYAKLTDLNDFALKAELPSNVSELTNDAGYITNSSLTSYATQEYVNTQISNLVNSAPEALNTLDELAAALNDDSNFATTVTNQIAAKLDITTYTSDKETFALKTELSGKADSSALANYLTIATAESTYAKKADIPSVPTTVSSFTNDAGYITEVPSEYVKEDELKTINGSSIIGTGNIDIEQDSFYTDSLSVNQTTLSNGSYLGTSVSTLYCFITSRGDYQIRFAKFGIGRVQTLIVENKYSGSINIYFTSSEMDVKILNGENKLQLDAGEILEVSCIQTQDNAGYIRWAKSVPTDPYNGYIGI